MYQFLYPGEPITRPDLFSGDIVPKRARPSKQEKIGPNRHLTECKITNRFAKKGIMQLFGIIYICSK